MLHAISLLLTCVLLSFASTPLWRCVSSASCSQRCLRCELARESGPEAMPAANCRAQPGQLSAGGKCAVAGEQGAAEQAADAGGGGRELTQDAGLTALVEHPAYRRVASALLGRRRPGCVSDGTNRRPWTLTLQCPCSDDASIAESQRLYSWCYSLVTSSDRPAKLLVVCGSIGPLFVGLKGKRRSYDGQADAGGLRGRNRDMPATGAGLQEVEQRPRSQQGGAKQLRFAKPASGGSDGRSAVYEPPVRSRGCFGCFS